MYDDVTSEVHSVLGEHGILVALVLHEKMPCVVNTGGNTSCLIAIYARKERELFIEAFDESVKKLKLEPVLKPLLFPEMVNVPESSGGGIPFMAIELRQFSDLLLKGSPKCIEICCAPTVLSQHCKLLYSIPAWNELLENVLTRDEMGSLMRAYTKASGLYVYAKLRELTGRLGL